jgi:hypothetical protein
LPFANDVDNRGDARGSLPGRHGDVRGVLRWGIARESAADQHFPRHREGGRSYQIYEILGHSDVEVTLNVYDHPEPENFWRQ